jgi:hypothetical protein
MAHVKWPAIKSRYSKVQVLWWSCVFWVSGMNVFAFISYPYSWCYLPLSKRVDLFNFWQLLLLFCPCLLCVFCFVCFFFWLVGGLPSVFYGFGFLVERSLFWFVFYGLGTTKVCGLHCTSDFCGNQLTPQKKKKPYKISAFYVGK